MVMAILMGLGIYNLDKFIIIEYVFFVLYFTFIVLMAGIDKEYRTINKPVLMYGVIISIMYIIYLYIIEKTSIYRYVIYLALFLILLLLDTIKLKKHAQNSYLYSILMVIIIMAIFTGEYITLNSIIITLIVIAFVLICKMTNKNKNVKTEKQYSKQLKIGLYLALSDIVCLMLSLALTYLMP